MQPPPKKLIRLVYENGVFRPTEPVDYPNGSEVMVELFTERELEERLIEQLYEEGLLVRFPKEDGDDDIDDKALLAKLHASLRGTSLSDVIIEDREDRV